MKNKTMRDEMKKVDPLLKSPCQNLEQNLSEGIEEMVPDPDDIPGGMNANLSDRPTLEEGDTLANTNSSLAGKIILPLHIFFLR